MTAAAPDLSALRVYERLCRSGGTPNGRFLHDLLLDAFQQLGRLVEQTARRAGEYGHAQPNGNAPTDDDRFGGLRRLFEVFGEDASRNTYRKAADRLPGIWHDMLFGRFVVHIDVALREGGWGSLPGGLEQAAMDWGIDQLGASR